MNDRDWLTTHTEQFYKQAQEDAEYSKRFMERLAEVARNAQSEHEAKQPKPKFYDRFVM